MVAGASVMIMTNSLLCFRYTFYSYSTQITIGVIEGVFPFRKLEWSTLRSYVIACTQRIVFAVLFLQRPFSAVSSMLALLAVGHSQQAGGS